METGADSICVVRATLICKSIARCAGLSMTLSQTGKCSREGRLPASTGFQTEVQAQGLAQIYMRVLLVFRTKKQHLLSPGVAIWCAGCASAPRWTWLDKVPIAVRVCAGGNCAEEPTVVGRAVAKAFRGLWNSRRLIPVSTDSPSGLPGRCQPCMGLCRSRAAAGTRRAAGLDRSPSPGAVTS